MVTTRGVLTGKGSGRARMTEEEKKVKKAAVKLNLKKKQLE